MRIFFLLFLLFPLAELYVLIKVGSSIGALMGTLVALDVRTLVVSVMANSSDGGSDAR